MIEEYRERMERFNETTGVMGYISVRGPLGGNYHPDRCYCQGGPNPAPKHRPLTDMDLRRGVCGPNGDTTPHKHYSDSGKCARCLDCTGYVPHDEKKKLDLLADAREIVAAARGGYGD